MTVALISVTIVNVLVFSLTIFLNVFVIVAVKTTPQLRNKYHALLTWAALRTNQIVGFVTVPSWKKNKFWYYLLLLNSITLGGVISMRSCNHRYN